MVQQTPQRERYLTGRIADPANIGAGAELIDSTPLQEGHLVLVRADEDQVDRLEKQLGPNPQVAHSLEEAQKVYAAAAEEDASPREAKGSQTQYKEQSGG